MERTVPARSTIADQDADQDVDTSRFVVVAELPRAWLVVADYWRTSNMMGTFLPSTLVVVAGPARGSDGGSNASHGALLSPLPLSRPADLRSVWASSVDPLLFSSILTKSRWFLLENPHQLHHQAWLLSWTLMYWYFPGLAAQQSPHWPRRPAGTSIVRPRVAALPWMALYKGVAGKWRSKSNVAGSPQHLLF